MKIHMFIQWWERKPDFSPDYYKEHHGTIDGETPGECMQKFNAFRENHDIAKYTPMQILYIY